MCTLSRSPTCREVGGGRAAGVVAVVLPAGLVGRAQGAAVLRALLHRPGAGLPLPLHQCLAAAHLLQVAPLHVLGLDPGLLLLPDDGEDGSRAVLLL